MATIEKHDAADVVRSSPVELTRTDLADLDLIRRSPERLREIGAQDVAGNETALVHAVFEEGMRAVKERIVADDYAGLADDLGMKEGRRELEHKKQQLRGRPRNNWDS